MAERSDELSRREQRNKRDNAYQKANGYVAQKKYREAHKGSHYEPKIRIPMEYKNELSQLLKEEEMSLTQLFIFLVREKYGIDFSKSKNSLK